MNISREVHGSGNVSSKDEVVKPLFDIRTLDFYCRYIISSNQNIRVSGLNLVKELFDRIDPSTYGSDIERVKRIEFVKRGLEARLVKKLNNKDLIIQYINGGPLDKPLLDTSYLEEISDEVLAYLNEQASELAKSYFVDEKYERILGLSTDLRNANYTRRSEVINEIQNLTSELNMKFNKMDDAINSSQMFTLIPGEFENVMSDIYARETSPSRVLRTGMVGMNTMLDGGFQSSRVYLLLAQAAGGKSFTMIDLAMQIKKYNKDYIPHDPTKIPTIIFLTMENSEDENVSRMMSMMTGKTFNDLSLAESMEAFRNNGMNYSKEDPIDIVMVYKPNLSVNTDYMYTLVDKMRELGREPICFFQDHIKRIRPVNKRNDLRLDLGEVINEFKAFANDVGIPVITDSHLNREAAKTLDPNTDNKKDLIRTLGSFNVSESYLMIDNCDVGIIINKELDDNKGLYMGFKCIKTRTKCDLDIFYHPYMPNNSIKFVEDLTASTPSFRRSLTPEQAPLRKPMIMNGIRDNAELYGGYTPHHENNRDEDDWFTDKVMNSADGLLDEPVDDNIILPDNKNQNMIAIGGRPSEPIYPMPQVIQQPQPTIPEYHAPTEWELKLEELMKNPSMKAAVLYDKNGDGTYDYDFGYDD